MNHLSFLTNGLGDDCDNVKHKNKTKNRLKPGGKQEIGMSSGATRYTPFMKGNFLATDLLPLSVGVPDWYWTQRHELPDI